MTSPRQIAANRRNARNSRGPRTPRGKSRSSVNALCHGLTTIHRHNPVYADEVEQIAKALCDGDESQELRAQAIAMRIARMHARAAFAQGPSEIAENSNVGGPLLERSEVNRPEMKRGALRKTERYERRAWSSLTRNIRGFLLGKERLALQRRSGRSDGGA